MPELIFLLALAGLLWFWFDHQTVQARAIDYCRRACADKGLQFLDETVALSRFRLKRDAAGVVRPERRFTFEFSADPVSRGTGYIVMHGRLPVAFELTAPPKPI